MPPKKATDPQERTNQLLEQILERLDSIDSNTSYLLAGTIDVRVVER